MHMPNLYRTKGALTFKVHTPQNLVGIQGAPELECLICVFSAYTLKRQYTISYTTAFETAAPRKGEIGLLQPHGDHTLGKAEGLWVGCDRGIWQHGRVRCVDLPSHLPTFWKSKASPSWPYLWSKTVSSYFLLI